MCTCRNDRHSESCSKNNEGSYRIAVLDTFLPFPFPFPLPFPLLPLPPTPAVTDSLTPDFNERLPPAVLNVALVDAVSEDDVEEDDCGECDAVDAPASVLKGTAVTSQLSEAV